MIILNKICKTVEWLLVLDAGLWTECKYKKVLIASSDEKLGTHCTVVLCKFKVQIMLRKPNSWTRLWIMKKT